MKKQLKYAGFWRRFSASVIDSAILILLGIGISKTLGRNPFETNPEINSLFTLDNLLTYAVSFAFTTVFWVNYQGQTPGKRFLHVKVVKEDGSSVDWGTAIIRYISYLISVFTLYIGFLWMVVDRRKQTWHDKIARTLVCESDDKKPSVMAYIMPVLLLFIMSVSVFLVVGINAARKVRNITDPSNIALRKSRDAVSNFSPQVKIHWDKSQALFSQMKAAKDKSQVIKLNDENITELKKAIELDPGNARIWVELGAAYTWVSTKGTLEDSYQAYKKASELEPDNLVYNNEVGDALIKLEKYDQAILVLNKTIRRTDDSGYAYRSLGIAYEKLKVYDQARDSYQNALKQFQKQNSDGRYDTTILEIQKALARLPQ